MTDKELEQYYPDSCPKCDAVNFSILRKPEPIMKTIITDFPNIHCNVCNSNFIASDLVLPVEEVLVKAKNYPKEMTYDEALALK